MERKRKATKRTRFGSTHNEFGILRPLPIQKVFKVPYKCLRQELSRVLIQANQYKHVTR
jgi:hypothetical protein